MIDPQKTRIADYVIVILIFLVILLFGYLVARNYHKEPIPQLKNIIIKTEPKDNRNIEEIVDEIIQKYEKETGTRESH